MTARHGGDPARHGVVQVQEGRPPATAAGSPVRPSAVSSPAPARSSVAPTSDTTQASTPMPSRPRSAYPGRSVRMATCRRIIIEP
ncbi:hypothetical protein [Georgenia sp. SUBG003]|uniref:hypothetical protein n=1 Tax=Georgenia sp. SUBG003 TaxID=1497974 RepID=UPI003AB65B00